MIFLVSEIFDHLLDDVLRTKELDRVASHSIRQKYFSVQRLDDGQRLRHGLDELIDGQVVDDDTERVAAQPIDEIGRFAVLGVLVEQQDFLQSPQSVEVRRRPKQMTNISTKRRAIHRTNNGRHMHPSPYDCPMIITIWAAEPQIPAENWVEPMGCATFFVI